MFMCANREYECVMFDQSNCKTGEKERKGLRAGRERKGKEVVVRHT